MALSPETTALGKGAGVCPFVKSGRLINPYGFDPQGRKGGSGPRPGGEETLAPQVFADELRWKRGEGKVGGKEKKVTQVACGWSPAA